MGTHFFFNFLAVVIHAKHSPSESVEGANACKYVDSAGSKFNLVRTLFHKKYLLPYLRPSFLTICEVRSES